MTSMEILKLTKRFYGAFRDLFKTMILTDFPEYKNKTREHFASDVYIKRQFGLQFKFGAFLNNELVGVVLADRPYGGVMYVNWVFVDKQHQKKGLGSEMLGYIEKVALENGAHGIYLNTYDRDLGYYKRKGYEEFGFDDEGYYGIATYFMKKVLREPKEGNYLMWP